VCIDPVWQLRPRIAHRCEAPEGKGHKGVDAGDLVQCRAGLLKIGSVKRLRGPSELFSLEPPPGFGNSPLVFGPQGTAAAATERRVLGIAEILVPGLVDKDQKGARRQTQHVSLF